MTTIPAPEGLAAPAAYAMKRVPSADARRRSRPPAEPPAMGVIGGRESLSTHMVEVLPRRKVRETLIWPPCGGKAERGFPQGAHDLSAPNDMLRPPAAVRSTCHEQTATGTIYRETIL